MKRFIDKTYDRLQDRLLAVVAEGDLTRRSVLTYASASRPWACRAICSRTVRAVQVTTKGMPAAAIPDAEARTGRPGEKSFQLPIFRLTSGR
ncbi:MAG TPA: hypothetical protein PKH03_06395 [Syntrophales bacterium]|nr:hypothetical protein [Syntrophales bacterium]